MAKIKETEFFRLEPIRSRVSVYDKATGEFLCQLTKREVDSWVYRVERSRRQDAIDKIETRKVRIANAQAYLAERARRKAEAGIQMAFEF
jgi:hypothetical protein